MNTVRPLLRFTSALLASALLLTGIGHAKQGATDAIPGTSNGAVKSGGGGGGGGGGGKKSSTTLAPISAPAPAPQPIVTQTLTFTPQPVNGVLPLCTGAYRIDPYYPTLSLMTCDVELTGVNAPDGETLYVDVTGTGGTLYPFTSNAVFLLSGYGLSRVSIYITPGTTVTAVNVRRADGSLVAVGH